MAIGWGIDGYGRKWPICNSCGKTWGQMDPLDVVHDCPLENVKRVAPDDTDDSEPKEGESST